MKVREKCFTGDVEGFTTLCQTPHCRWFQPPSTVSATFTIFQLRKFPTWLPCTTVSFLLIVVQIATTVVSSTPPGQHILQLPLQHLQPHLHLEDREEGNRERTRLQWIWTQKRARWTKGHTQKPDVLGVSKSLLLTSWSYLMLVSTHFTHHPYLLFCLAVAAKHCLSANS